tara:strand:+ start:360 stop:1460 length:1101 start_codon:yes stop_codon:yes gene_type:complete
MSVMSACCCIPSPACGEFVCDGPYVNGKLTYSFASYGHATTNYKKIRCDPTDPFPIREIIKSHISFSKYVSVTFDFTARVDVTSPISYFKLNEFTPGFGTDPIDAGYIRNISITVDGSWDGYNQTSIAVSPGGTGCDWYYSNLFSETQGSVFFDPNAPPAHPLTFLNNWVVEASEVVTGRGFTECPCCDEACYLRINVNGIGVPLAYSGDYTSGQTDLTSECGESENVTHDVMNKTGNNELDFTTLGYVSADSDDAIYNCRDVPGTTYAGKFVYPSWPNQTSSFNVYQDTWIGPPTGTLPCEESWSRNFAPNEVARKVWTEESEESTQGICESGVPVHYEETSISKRTAHGSYGTIHSIVPTDVRP